MKQKNKNIILKMMIVVTSIVFSLLAFSGCAKIRKTDLTLNNYGDYLTVYSSINFAHGSGNLGEINYCCEVSIKKISDSVILEDVVIKYKVKVFDSDSIEKEEEFTESLRSLKNEHINSIDLIITGNDIFFRTINASAEVLEISGTGQLMSGETFLKICGIVLLFVFLLACILFFPIRAAIFSGKFSSITNGMEYQDVINILGHPRQSSSNQGITTCVWKRAVLRGLSKTYVLTFKDGKVIMGLDQNNWS